MTHTCCSMGESILFLTRKSGEGKVGMMCMCAFCAFKYASVCCFYSILQVAGMCKRACVCLVFLDFLYPLFLSLACVPFCVSRFFNSGDLDACYVSNFGGVLSVNLRSKPLFSVICLSRCVWDLFHSNIDVCCIRGKCD